MLNPIDLLKNNKVLRQRSGGGRDGWGNGEEKGGCEERGGGLGGRRMSGWTWRAQTWVCPGPHREPETPLDSPGESVSSSHSSGLEPGDSLTPKDTAGFKQLPTSVLALQSFDSPGLFPRPCLLISALRPTGDLNNFTSLF